MGQSVEKLAFLIGIFLLSGGVKLVNICQGVARCCVKIIDGSIQLIIYFSYIPSKRSDAGPAVSLTDWRISVVRRKVASMA